MTDKIALLNRILDHKSKQLTLSGISAEQFNTLLKIFFESSDEFNRKKNLFLFPNEQSAESFYSLTQEQSQTSKYYPPIGASPYSSIIPNETSLFQRFNVLNSCVQSKEKFNIVTTTEALFLKIPPKEFFIEESFKISISDIISPLDLSEQLIKLGYQRTLSIEEPGTFSNRGEIFDIYPLGNKPLRLYFFDEMIEEIFFINEDNFKTNRDKPIESFSVDKTPYSLLQEEFTTHFKNQFPRPKSDDFQQLEYRRSILKKLNNSQFFEDYPLFLSFFFEKSSTLLNYIDDYNIYFFDSYDIFQTFENFKQELESEYENYLEHQPEFIKPSPSSLFDLTKDLEKISRINVDNISIELNIDAPIEDTVNLNLQRIIKKKATLSHHQQVEELVQFIKDKVQNTSQVYILYTKTSTLNEMKYILTTMIGESFLSKVHFIKSPLDCGFEYINEKLVFLSESDFFQSKIKKTKKEKKQNFDNDLFADQLSTLEIGDYVIHKDHGLGKYLGVQTLNLNGSTSDFVTLEYQDEDKVYVPVYRLNLLQKYSTNQVQVSVANLKTKKFELIKSKALSLIHI